MKGLQVRGLNKKQKGMFTIDVAIGLAAMIAFLAYVMAKSAPLQQKTDEDLLIDGITHIMEGARSAKQKTFTGYQGMTISQLSAADYVPKTWNDGVGKNPQGGDYSLTGSTANTLVITATGINSTLCTRVADTFAKYTTATCSSGTVSVTTI